MSNYRFSDATGYSFAQLCEMHNASFSGYFFPATMTPESTADFWRAYQVDASRCVVMHDQDDTFVGMARMATRGKRGWCGGFGIVPEFRGRGVSKILAEQIVQVARNSGLTSLQLEVLCQNARAIKTYEHAGFVSTRRLFGLEVATAALPVSGISSASFFAPDVLLPWLQNSERQPWQREPASLLTQSTEAMIAPGSDGRLNGLIIERTGERVRIHGVVLQSQLTDAQLAGLLRRAAGDAPQIQLFNEPEGSPLLARCRQLGFSEFYSQHEMFHALSA